MVKLTFRQTNKDGTTTTCFVDADDNKKVIMITGVSPLVYFVDVIPKEKLHEKLKGIYEGANFNVQLMESRKPEKTDVSIYY
jgi:hypothetical protein